MLVRRFYDDRLAQASYLIGCQQTGEAIVIDPAREIAPYLEAARAEGVRITRVTETHIHADFMSGTRELAAATGAGVQLSGEGGTDWQYGFAATDRATLLHDGDVMALGNVRIDVMHTPGHTPEHLAFVIVDAVRGPEPVAMVSGDFIFVGDVGRPDLLETAAGVTGSKETSARALFASLQRLESLPDYLQIWPGHGAGSSCGKALGAVPTSTLGYERRTNWAFQQRNETAFVAAVLEGQPAPPRYFAVMKRINREGPPILGARAPLRALEAGALAGALQTGVVLDIRSKNAYAADHLAGTLNIPFIKAFTKWAGWFLPYDRDISLIAADESTARDARTALAAIGIDRVAGVFPADVITKAPAAMRRQIRRASMSDVATLQRQGVTVIDVREVDEWHHGQIPGAEHHPLGNVVRSLDAVDRNIPVAVHCEGGTRSAIGASVLEQMGFTSVIDLTGGWREWQLERETRDQKRETSGQGG